MEGEANDHVKIDADSLAYSLYELMPKNFSFSKKCCIFKIPNILRRHNPEAFVPNAFSIGPWHHGQEEHLKATEEIKLNYLRRLISRWPSPETKLKELIQAIGEIEEDVRAHYAEPIEMSVVEFVKLLVIDGCFLIELFRQNSEKCFRDRNDPIFHMLCMLEHLSHDLILLENQIPWSVLELLFNMTMEPGSPQSPPLEHFVISLFRHKFSPREPSLLSLYQGKHHILDLLREWLVSLSCLPRFVEEGDANEVELVWQQMPSALDDASEVELEWQQMPSAQSLEEAGVKSKKHESKSILDIKFVGGVLEVPSLLIQETTEDTFRNLISFEQCYSDCPAIITSYAVLLDNLINTEKDLKILCEEGIIVNWLTPEVATLFFNKLYQDTYVKEDYYGTLCEEVNEYCRHKWPKWRATYMHNYFGTPWAIVSQVFDSNRFANCVLYHQIGLILCIRTMPVAMVLLAIR